MYPPHKTPGLASGLSSQILQAEDDAQDARNSGDEQAKGYAESRAHRAKRQLAMIDPRGYGHQYLNLLSDGERLKALKA